jgi:hypothetical protein
MYHNVIYKNLLPQSCASMGDTIKLYAWQNVYSEITNYYTTSQLKVEEVLSPMASSLSSSSSPLSSSSATAAEKSFVTYADRLQSLTPPPPPSSPPPLRLHSSSSHFKRKSLEKCVTDRANLMQQLFNSKTYSGNLKLHLIDANTVYDLLLSTLSSSSVISDNVRAPSIPNMIFSSPPLPQPRISDRSHD